MSQLAPRVTVGIPVYNGEQWLETTLQSVLAQSLRDFTVIISDNASTDRSWEIAQAAADQDDRICCYRNESNLGVFRNLDRVFELSETPYFKWCPVGDLMVSTFLERAVDVLESEPSVALVYSSVKFFGSMSDHSDLVDMDVKLDMSDPIARFSKYLSAQGLNSPFHGLIRSRALARTGLNKCFARSDLSMISAVLLQGSFVRFSDELLLRRIEPSTATAVKSQEDLDEFFGAQAAELKKLPVWKLERQLFRELMGSPVGLASKFRGTAFLLRRLNWQRKSLLREWWARFYGPR